MVFQTHTQCVKSQPRCEPTSTAQCSSSRAILHWGEGLQKLSRPCTVPALRQALRKINIHPRITDVFPTHASLELILNKEYARPQAESINALKAVIPSQNPVQIFSEDGQEHLVHPWQQGPGTALWGRFGGGSRVARAAAVPILPSSRCCSTAEQPQK